MKKLLLTLLIAGLAAWQANATLVGTTADYKIYEDDFHWYYNDGTPRLGTYQWSGTATWVDSVLFAGYVVASPSGSENILDWWPLGDHNDFTAQLTCQFVAPADGIYNFGTYSGDGSALYLDGTLVVNNGWDHDARGEAATAFLTAGTHSLVTTYRANDAGGSNFTVGVDPRLMPVPEPSTCIAGVLLLLPFGASALRRFRKNRAA